MYNSCFKSAGDKQVEVIEGWAQHVFLYADYHSLLSLSYQMSSHNPLSWVLLIYPYSYLKAILYHLQEFYVSVSDDTRMIAALKEQLPELEKIVKQM